jgi:hypothetical protein
MQNMKNLLTFCLMVCCVAVQAQLVTYPEGLDAVKPVREQDTAHLVDDLKAHIEAAAADLDPAVPAVALVA